MYSKLKTYFDFVLATILVILFSPIFLIITAILFLQHQNNPFFVQTRIGKNESLFTILKFKTMNEKKDQNGHLLSDELRTTTFGLFLRKSGLDELPQLINILKGEMSFVGPRPLLPEYLPLFDSFSRRRHSVKPGITGLAQVDGGNSLAWDKRFEKDIYYIKNLTFAMDVSIFWKTIHYVFSTKKENVGKLH